MIEKKKSSLAKKTEDKNTTYDWFQPAVAGIFSPFESEVSTIKWKLLHMFFLKKTKIFHIIWSKYTNCNKDQTIQ